MAGNTQPSTRQMWPFWPPLWGDISRSAEASSRGASGSFVQPILPGWVFGNVYNVTTQNSSDPQAEADIVAVHGYGRQIGRIMDALELVITELLPQERHAADPIKKFEELRRQVDHIKRGAVAKWSDNVASRLDDLKTSDPQEYARVAARLEKALGNKP